MKKSTFDFLKKLSKNNNREWFKTHEKLYNEAKEDFQSFVWEVAAGISEFEPRLIPDTKHIKFFRIYRDVRFSKDKSPYKTNFGAFISINGMTGYYIHIEPSNCGLAGGAHELQKENLQKVREYLLENYKNLETILRDSDFKKYFKEFGIKELSVKTVPRGFDKHHPAIEYIRQKSFTVWHNPTEAILTSKDPTEYVIKVFAQLKKLNDFLDKPLKLNIKKHP